MDMPFIMDSGVTVGANILQWHYKQRELPLHILSEGMKVLLPLFHAVDSSALLPHFHSNKSNIF